MAGSSIHGKTWAYYIESTQGEGPGYSLGTPQGTAAGWASAEGTDAFRFRAIEMDPAWVRRADVENPQLVTSILAENVSIRGIGSADGGSVSLTLHGSESATADASQITETALMTLLEHSFGGMVLGNTTAVAASPTDDDEYDVDSATNLQVGQLIALEDADNTGSLYPQRIQTLSSTSITTERVIDDFAVAEDDVVHAVATLYPDGSALSDTADGGYSTISVLYNVNGTIYEATGCVAQVDSIDFPRNDVPRINFSLMAGGVWPPGPEGISAPTFTGTIQGDAGRPIGIKTRLHIGTYGSTTDTCYDAANATFSPGLPRQRIETVTQCGATLEGTAGYTLGREQSVFEVAVLLDSTNATTFQTAFDNKTALTLTYYYIGAAGDCWCLHLPKCYVNAPVYTEASETKWITLSLVAHEDDGLTNGTTPDLAKARFLLGIY